MNFPAMMLYWGDYLRDTGHLSTEQHGALLLLLAHAWTHDGLLPLDDEALRRITRLDPKPWTKSRAVIVAFFHRAEDGYRQKRVEKELAKARASVARNQEQRDATAERTRQWRERQNGNPPPPKPNGQAPPGDASVTRHKAVTEHVTTPSPEASRDAAVTPLPLPVPEPYPVPEEREDFNKNNLLSSQNVRARGSRDQISEPNALDALLAEAHIEPPKLVVVNAPEEPSRAEKAMQLAAKTVIGKVARKLESTGMRPATKYAVHSVREQIVASVTRPEPQIPKGLEAHIHQQRQQLMRAAIERVRLVA